MAKYRLTSGGLIDVDFTGIRLTSGGLIKSTNVDIVKRAIRSDVGWATMTAEEQAVYDDIHYTLLSTWESTIPPDLVAVDEQWVAECYNDWVGGLDDIYNEIERTTDTTRNIHITSPVGERHTGIKDTGFSLKSSVVFPFRISSQYTEVSFIQAESTVTGGLSFVANAAALYHNVNSVISISLGANSSSFYIYAGANYGKFTNCIGINSDGNIFRSLNLWQDIYNCDAIGSNSAYGFRTNNSHDVINCISTNATVDYLSPMGTNSATNATDQDGSSDPSITIANLSLVDGVDFTEPSTGNYNLTHDSKLHGQGTDVGLTSDIIAKDYRAFNGTTYIPIGAFNGLSKFTAIRIDQTAFDTLSALLQARYEGNWQSLLSTWESNMSTDLVTDNIQEVAECYNDFVGGLDDPNIIIAATHVTDINRNIVIDSPVGERHNGIPRSGFYIAYDSQWSYGLTVNPEFTVLRHLDIINSAAISNVTTIRILGANVTIRDLVLDGSLNAIRQQVALDYLKIYNNLFLNSQAEVVQNAYNGIYTAYNNTLANCEKGFYYVSGSSYPIIRNNVVVDSTSDCYSGVYDASSTNNADDDGTALALGIGNNIGVVSSSDGVDFTEPSKDDYSIPTGSKLIDEGTDLTSEGFTTDIVGNTRG